MPVIVTAGHVDHGKSTLVRALTGTDPDRWAEEKERGLTIDLGFAWTTLPGGHEVAFVDVPGHVRFLKNMLAGVGGVDGCLLVVAATEGWKPQSEEHLRILELVGIARGVVALTKADLVDDDRLVTARDEVAARLAGSFLAGAEVVEVDAPAGAGVTAVADALDRLVAAAPASADRDRPRLWVDRSFAARGSGTVVTGTLTGGRLAVGDTVELQPGGATARIRGLQSHKAALDVVGPGHRVAVNLAGVAHRDVERGHAVIRSGQWEATRTVDASLSVLAALDHPVSRRGAFQAYVGAGEHAVRVRILGPDELAPGATGSVRLHLPVALPLLPGDRYVLRESGRGETVGGGEVLDVAPVLPAAKARPDRDVARVVAERGWVEADHLERLTGVRREPDVGRWVVDPAVLEMARSTLAATIEAAGERGFDLATLDEHDRALVHDLDVDMDAGRARARGTSASPPHPWVDAVAGAPFAPPPPDGIDRAVVRDLVRRGLVVEADGLYFAPDAIAAAARVVAGLLAAAPDGVTVAAIREALGTTRKWALPIVGHLDATGVTRRRGDVRIAGPRLPT